MVKFYLNTELRLDSDTPQHRRGSCMHPRPMHPCRTSLGNTAAYPLPNLYNKSSWRRRTKNLPRHPRKIVEGSYLNLVVRLSNRTLVYWW